MSLFSTLFLSTLSIFIEVLQLMMVGRAIFSWFPNLSSSPFGEFLYTFTEWFILPVRKVFEKFGFANNMMLDIPFFVTYLLIAMIGSVL